MVNARKHNWVYKCTTEWMTESYVCSFCGEEAGLDPEDDRYRKLPDDECAAVPEAPSLFGKVSLWLDDERKAPRGWVHCTRVADAKVLLLAGIVEHASLDHDLGFVDDEDPLKCVECENGYDLVKWMAEHNVWPTKSVYVHSANPCGAANMKAVIEKMSPYGTWRR